MNAKTPVESARHARILTPRMAHLGRATLTIAEEALATFNAFTQVTTGTGNWSPVGFGQTNTIKIGLATINPYSGTFLPSGPLSPGGAIDVLEDDSIIGSAALSTVDGVTSAEFDTSSLAVGLHTLKLRYPGDKAFQPVVKDGIQVRVRNTHIYVTGWQNWTRVDGVTPWIDGNSWDGKLEYNPLSTYRGGIGGYEGPSPGGTSLHSDGYIATSTPTHIGVGVRFAIGHGFPQSPYPTYWNFPYWAVYVQVGSASLPGSSYTKDVDTEETPGTYGVTPGNIFADQFSQFPLTVQLTPI